MKSLKLSLTILISFFFVACSTNQSDISEKSVTSEKDEMIEINLSSFEGMTQIFAKPELRDEYEISVRATSGVEQETECGTVKVAQMLIHSPDKYIISDLALEITLEGALLRFTRSHSESQAWTPVQNEKESEYLYRAGELTAYLEGKRHFDLFYWSSSALRGVPLVIQTEIQEEPITLEFRIQKKGDNTPFCDVG